MRVYSSLDSNAAIVRGGRKVFEDRVKGHLLHDFDVSLIYFESYDLKEYRLYIFNEKRVLLDYKHKRFIK